MNLIFNRFCLLLLLPLLATYNYAEAADAEEKKFTYVIHAGSYLHFNPSPEHTNKPIITSFEMHKSNLWFYGLSLFNNSFDQFSQIIYIGKEFKSGRESLENFHLKIIAGLIHGYKDEYQDKIPFNGLGIAPGILPSIGYKRADSRWGVDLSLLGAAGMALTVSFEL